MAEVPGDTKASGGGMHNEGVQVRVDVCRCALAGDQLKGTGWGMSAGTRYLHKGSGMGPVSETVSEYVCLCVAKTVGNIA